MECRAVLFDLDGTLVDTVDLWVDSYRATLTDFGVRLEREVFMETIYSRNRPLTEVLADVGLADEDGFRSHRDRRYIDSLVATEWLPGALDVLRRARATRPVGIVTAAWRSYVDAVDTTCALRREVDTVVDADDTHGRPKPDPHGLLVAARRLGVEPGACWYVGDQAFDVEAAQRAGMTSCLVRTAHLRGDPTADVTFESLDEIDLPAS